MYVYYSRTEKIETIKTEKTKKKQERDIIISSSGIQGRIIIFISYLVDSEQSRIKYKKFILSSIYVIVKLKYFFKKKIHSTSCCLIIILICLHILKITFSILINLKIKIK